MSKAEEGPLDVEDVAADHVGFAVLHQELKAVRGLLHLLLMHHIANEALVHILCREGTSRESAQESPSPPLPSALQE